MQDKNRENRKKITKRRNKRWKLNRFFSKRKLIPIALSSAANKIALRETEMFSSHFFFFCFLFSLVASGFKVLLVKNKRTFDRVVCVIAYHSLAWEILHKIRSAQNELQRRFTRIWFSFHQFSLTFEHLWILFCSLKEKLGFPFELFF